MLDCLIIDDEISIAETICEYFNLFGLTSACATDYQAGLAAATEQQPSLILLDVNLNGQSGFSLCKTLRETSDVPILFISARNTDDDVLAGLGVGGDDYVTKPFSMAVLLAKAKAMLKRGAAKTAPQETARFGKVEIDRGSGNVWRGGGPVKLKPMEQKLLLYLLDNRGRRVSKDELLEKVWGDTFIGEGTLSVHIRHLREKLEDDPKNPRYIKTVWGSGYMFEAQG
jgi:two-component system response regulator RegX3